MDGWTSTLIGERAEGEVRKSQCDCDLGQGQQGFSRSIGSICKLDLSTLVANLGWHLVVKMTLVSVELTPSDHLAVSICTGEPHLI